MTIAMEFCDHKLEISGWNLKVRLLLQVSLKLLCLQLASGSVQALCNGELEIDPQAPGCLDDCEGRRFFLGRDGMCKMCVQCEPGFEHDKFCGDGENGDAVCIPCPEGHYSYNRYECLACRVCEKTVLTRECSATTDRQCGECLQGFYRDPQNPDLCNQRCEWLSNPKPTLHAWLGWQISKNQLNLPSYPRHLHFLCFQLKGLEVCL
ncbi:tumor necrosis factor receptor superfamily member 27 isoform X2 [Strongylocentrotus purpuratus]|uniref:TNFR-Cys domain-containing protein n=1 Tax=Strongylocentrotus purpuratus TaxID=7668 RepID=A0A7M7NBN0_STRPU|nr:tumor necrosis factor receptor superfamily member 27 isoform X2 [Strongylocentrotus purpuratus]